MTVSVQIDAGTNQGITLTNVSDDFAILVTVFDELGNSANVIVDGNELMQAVSKCMVITTE